MDNQLRPLNLGEILDRTADLYRSRFLLFTGISAVFAAVMLAVQLLHLGAIHLMGYPHIEPHLQWAYFASAGVDYLFISLMAGLSIAASSRAVAWVYLGKPATIYAAVSSIFAKVGRYLWLMTVTMFFAWWPLFVVYVLLFGIIFAAGFGGDMFAPQATPHPTTYGPGAVAGALIGILLVLVLLVPAFVYGVFMWLRYSLAMPACVVEGSPAGYAIKRGITLSEDSRLRIFVLWLLVFLVRFILAILFGFPLLWLAIKHLGQPIPIGWMIFQQFGVFVAATLIGPLYSIGLTLFYYDQRIRKEGYDIEWMMQAAGLLPEQAGGELAGTTVD
ncbi:MAG: hypothetical protein ABSD59_13920 [Terracidiphilus sp.]|jgi:hypothetical protein